MPIEIKKDIYHVGVVDWNIRDFHGYSTYKGTSYNAYLALDDKKALFDTVKKPFCGQLLHNIRKVVDPRSIDYLIVNHVEMDHSGSIPEVIEAIQPEKVFCSTMGKKALEAHFGSQRWPLEVVKSGQEISLGSRTVRFLETRMLHWPDSMFSYIPEEKLLISNDAFGQHWATSETFDDQVALSELMRHAAKYYANILLPYSPLVQKLLATVSESGLEIETIAPDHGIIWRSQPKAILEAYDTWSRQESQAKALIIYDTMWHSTEKMAHAVASGLAEEGVSYKVLSLKHNHRSDVMTEVLDSRALLFGCPTLNNGMLPTMADMLCYLKGLKPANKIATAFGSYGWSGEAVKLITQQLQEMKLDVLEPGLRVQYVPDHEALAQCVELGRQVGRAVKESTP
ncbi:Flavorubredoxin [Desulfacinum hydrothermale DSM 13146]|uniref:Flavorubredoxin n=2 Tax=Desulfacinum hydrothermale TaxID=109258 RepID=A0A1W1XHX8_9BACT|nr:flavodoxin domain-containing protein [Desulfacinum hydrothermale]SMC23108.1 Flavorubredoxin [Desulfacinum hydrothermale DSM 13146]